MGNESSKLVAGLIPANTACPFLSRCKFKVHTCPGVDGKTKAGHFSCPAAKMFDKAEKEKET